MGKAAGALSKVLNYRLRVTLNDGRNLVGQLLAFDSSLNLVLKECSEERVIKSKKGKADDDEEEEVIRRTLGLTILRGDSIVTLTVDGPPPVEDDSKGPQIGAGPGIGGPAGRGMGLQAPTMRQAPQNFAPPPGMPGMMGGFAPPPPGFMPPPPGFGGR